MQTKILIISNASLNQSDSNGRTILRLVDCFGKEQKTQFYTYGNPDFNECNSFYHVSDRDALHSLLKFETKNGEVDTSSVISAVSSQTKKKGKKTPLKMLIREVVWKYGRWNNKYLKKWINDVSPSCILVVAGDNCFTLDLARNIAKEKNIPIFLYSTEEYPFKDYNFVTKRFSLFYLIWRRKLLKAYKRIEKFVRNGVFNSEALAKLYESKYSYNCSCIYQSSNIDFVENCHIQNTPVVSYLGNLGLNRHKALIEIANVLSGICPEAKLNIYGNANETVKKTLEEKPNIILHGFVSYDEVVRVIHNSTLLIHAEYNDPFYNRDLKYAFSTKITDSVCSGTPFLIYAPIEYEETLFLKNNKCAFVANNRKELEFVLADALFDHKKRKEIVSNARLIKDSYFTNKGEFKKIVEEALNESNPN